MWEFFSQKKSNMQNVEPHFLHLENKQNVVHMS